MPVSCVCLVCQKPFSVKPSLAQRGGGKYCSRQCTTRIAPCVCLTCDKPFTLRPSEVRKGRGKYCSHACYHQRAQPSYVDRFWAFVLKADGCWIWQGGRDRKGYGHFTLPDKQQRQAHRLAYELTFGPILPGVHCLHTCDNPPCCNPAHLWIGTRSDNMRDMVYKQRGRWNKRL